MNNHSNIELETKAFKLETENARLKKENANLREVVKLTSKIIEETFKPKLNLFNVIKTKALRKEAYTKSESHGKSGESNYFYTNPEVAQAHIDLKNISVEICQNLYEFFITKK